MRVSPRMPEFDALCSAVRRRIATSRRSCLLGLRRNQAASHDERRADPSRDVDTTWTRRVPAGEVWRPRRVSHLERVHRLEPIVAPSPTERTARRSPEGPTASSSAASRPASRPGCAGPRCCRARDRPSRSTSHPRSRARRAAPWGGSAPPASLVALSTALVAIALPGPNAPPRATEAAAESPPEMDRATAAHEYDPATGFIVARETIPLPPLAANGLSLEVPIEKAGSDRHRDGGAPRHGEISLDRP